MKKIEGYKGDWKPETLKCEQCRNTFPFEDAQEKKGEVRLAWPKKAGEVTWWFTCPYCDSCGYTDHRVYHPDTALWRKITPEHVAIAFTVFVTLMFTILVLMDSLSGV